MAGRYKKDMRHRVILISWNMQGAGGKDCNKGYALSDMLGRKSITPDIVMLQECGNTLKENQSVLLQDISEKEIASHSSTSPESQRSHASAGNARRPSISPTKTKRNLKCRPKLIDQKYMCKILRTASGAKNLRCTTAILVRNSLKAYDEIKAGIIPYEKMSKQGLEQQCRPLLYVILHHVCFATIHAIANQPLAKEEIETMLRSLEEKKNKQKFKHWVLIGDFNCEPHVFSREHCRTGIYKFQLNNNTIYMLCPLEATQGSDKNRVDRRNHTLDYLFYDSDSFLSFRSIDRTEQRPNFSYPTRPRDSLGNIMIPRGLNEKGISANEDTISDHNLIGVEVTICG